jgi:hypothetical protein
MEHLLEHRKAAYRKAGERVSVENGIELTDGTQLWKKRTGNGTASIVVLAWKGHKLL